MLCLSLTLTPDFLPDLVGGVSKQQMPDFRKTSEARNLDIADARVADVQPGINVFISSKNLAKHGRFLLTIGM
jgi:hypothetical protein